jgi:hypothetical protein
MLNLQKIKLLSKDLVNYLIATAILFLVVGIYFRFEALEAVRITEWITRDFDRAFHLFDGDYIPLAGPERNAGGRLLGPFLYFFLTIPLFVNYSYESIYVFNLILNIGSVVFFFWFIHKYFGIVTSSIASILLSVNLVHIDSAGFPINPTFMLPLLFVYLRLFFKIAIDNKTSYVPWIFVVISLGIQMHFSMATYYLAPLVVCLLFKIKIKLRQIGATALLVGFCFVPYLIYKQQYYEVNLEITKTFFHQDYSFLSLLKIFSLQNVLFRINQGTSLYGYYSIPSYVVQIEYFFSVISFYGLTIFIGMKLIGNGIQSCKKEIIIFLVFYIPALIYEITNPQTGWHFWHYFIFIPPMIMIKGRFCGLILENLNSKVFKNATCILLIGIMGIVNWKVFQNINILNSTSSLIIKNANFYISKNLKSNLNALLHGLNLNAKEFFERVYIQGLPIGSLKYLELSKDSSFNSKEASKEINSCFYVVFGYKVEKEKFYLNNDFLIYGKMNGLEILKDRFLDVKAPQIIKGDKYNSKSVFMVYPYRPKLNQPCYTNTRSAFAVGKQIDNYLKSSFAINKEKDHELIAKQLTEQIVFDEFSLLNKLKKKIIFFDPKINTPIQIDFVIENLDGKYRVRTELIYYSWGKEARDYFKVKQLDLKIIGKNQTIIPVEISIINSDSWIANKTLDTVTENFSWYREFDLPEGVDLKKDNFQIKLLWDVRFPSRKDKCCLKFETDIQP